LVLSIETEFSSTPKGKAPFQTFEATSCSKFFKNNLLQFRMFDELMELLPKVSPAELEETTPCLLDTTEEVQR
jgi:hypothetical protein